MARNRLWKLTALFALLPMAAHAAQTPPGFQPRTRGLETSELAVRVNRILHGEELAVPVAHTIEGVPLLYQHGKPWCLITCLRMVLNYYGLNIESNTELATQFKEAFGQEVRGRIADTHLPAARDFLRQQYHPSIQSVLLAANEASFERVRRALQFLLANDIPCILALKVKGGGHAMVAVGYDRENLILHDPWRKTRTKPYADFREEHGLYFLGLVGATRAELTDAAFQGKTPEPRLTVDAFTYRCRLRENMLILVYGSDVTPARLRTAIRLLDRLQETAPADLRLRFYRMHVAPRDEYFLDLYREGKHLHSQRIALTRILYRKDFDAIGKTLFARLRAR